MSEKLVLTTGCYDILHSGHVRHLRRARELGDLLLVALNSDESVRYLKGPNRPINRWLDRAYLLLALRCVDRVVPFGGDTLDLVQSVRPDVLAVGYGYTLDIVIGRSIVEAYGGRVVVTCNDSGGISTTKILERVCR